MIELIWILAIVVLIFVLSYVVYRFWFRKIFWKIFDKFSPKLPNEIFIHNGFETFYDLSPTVFRSGSFESYFWRIDKSTFVRRLFFRSIGSKFDVSVMKLRFYPKDDHRIEGEGLDQIGRFVVSGRFSPRTLRMAMEKRYLFSTADQFHLQVVWKPNRGLFQGTCENPTTDQVENGRFFIEHQQTIVSISSNV